ncbi:MAG: hypothetical protein NXH73_09030 [Flavobacteriaceae bacterium]|nr:hypothetical protein [Flavobacteriaceae bacterium]
MDASELKLKIFRQIETLEKSKLQQVYDLVLNLVKKEPTANQWDDLSKSQQQGLLDAIEEMNTSEGVEHQSVIKKYKRKYG